MEWIEAMAHPSLWDGDADVVDSLNLKGFKWLCKGLKELARRCNSNGSFDWWKLIPLMQLLMVAASVQKTKVIDMMPTVMTWADAESRFRKAVDSVIEEETLFINPEHSIDNYPMLRTVCAQAPTLRALGEVLDRILPSCTSEMEPFIWDALRSKLANRHWSFLPQRNIPDLASLVSYVYVVRRRPYCLMHL